MSSRDLLVEWSSEPFLRDATQWVDTTLASHNVERKGPLAPFKVRFWAAVYQVPTDAGTLWFKACSPAFGHEPALTQAIANIAPHLVLTPLGVDTQRLWMLTPDGGPTLRDTLADHTDSKEGILHAIRFAAAMQRELVPHRDALLATGLPLLEAADAETYFHSEVDRLAALPQQHLGHVPAREARDLVNGWNTIQPSIDLLKSSRVPSTLQHNDLHDGNIFSARRTGHFSVFDLGDAVWSHPFAVLQVPREIAEGHARDTCIPSILDEHRQGSRDVFDAYLPTWADYGDVERLVPEAVAADALATLHRYRSWAASLAIVDHPKTAAQFDFVPRLGDLLHRAVGTRAVS